MNEPLPLPTLSMTESLQKSWKAVTANIGPMIGFTVLYYIVTGVLGRIPGVSSVSNLFSFIYGASMFSAFYHIDRYGSVSFRDFFTWTPKTGRLILSYIATVAVVIVLFIPMLAILLFSGANWSGIITSLGNGYYGETLGNISAGTILGLAVSFLLAMILLLIISFALMFIVQFQNVSLGAAFRMSWSIGRNNIGQIMLFLLLAIGVFLLGVLALLVGLLMAIPVVVGMQYYFLRSLFSEEVQQWDFMKGPEPLA